MGNKVPADIPFNRSTTIGKELLYIAESLLGGQIAGDQSFTRKCQAILESVTGCRKSLLTTSCTHALEMSALLLDIAPGDEVIVPSFTFVSTANAFALRGAKPVFIDVKEEDFNLDETQLEKLITPRTKAVVPVHYAGVGCEMSAIEEICRAHNIAIVEDNAHGLFGHYRGRPLGSFGQMATQSFHETKNITCGEGGALLVNDPKFIERAEILREKGTNRSRFFRGQVDKYTWVDLGSSYLMADVLAAFLYGQLEQWRQVQQSRKTLWDYYHLHLADWAYRHGVRLPRIPTHCSQAYHMYFIVAPSLKFRQGLIGHLKSQGIMSVFHYQPLHTSEMGMKFGGRPGDCPVTEMAGDCLLRLPFYNSMTPEEVARATTATLSYRGE